MDHRIYGEEESYGCALGAETEIEIEIELTLCICRYKRLQIRRCLYLQWTIATLIKRQDLEDSSNSSQMGTEKVKKCTKQIHKYLKRRIIVWSIKHSIA